MIASTLSPARYGKLLILVAGFGGLLYGIDIGIIAAALLYLSKTVSLTVAQTSIIVAAVLGGERPPRWSRVFSPTGSDARR